MQKKTVKVFDQVESKLGYIQYVEKITTILTNPSFLLKFLTTRLVYLT